MILKLLFDMDAWGNKLPKAIIQTNIIKNKKTFKSIEMVNSESKRGFFFIIKDKFSKLIN